MIKNKNNYNTQKRPFVLNIYDFYNQIHNFPIKQNKRYGDKITCTLK